MKPTKTKVLALDEDDEWDDWGEEEEDEIIYEEEEDDLDIDDSTSQATRKPRRPQVKKKTPSGKGYGKKVVSWTLRIIVVLLVALLLFFPGYPFHDIREMTGINSLKNLMRPYLPFPEWVNASVTLTYALSVSNGRAESVRIQVAPPFDIPFDPGPGHEKDFLIQDVLDVSFLPGNTIPVADWDTERNSITGWELTNIQGTYNFKVTFNMTLHAYEWEITEEGSGDISDIPQEYKDLFNHNAWPVDRDEDGIPDHFRYEPEDATITEIAEMITKDEDTVLGKVRAIYDWMEERFNYTTSDQRLRDRQIYGDYPKWATGCLADWYGDCDDQSLLMASLCRAVDIPAWLEIGYLFDPNPNARTWGGHGWFNVLIPLKGGDDFIIGNIDPVNHEFLFRDPYRFTDWVDNGQDVNVEGETMYNLDYYYNYFNVRKASRVQVVIDPAARNDRFDDHGSIKIYSDKPLTEGNLPGTQKELPAPSPLLLAPLALLLIAVPVRRAMIKRDR